MPPTDLAAPPARSDAGTVHWVERSTYVWSSAGGGDVPPDADRNRAR